MTSVGMLVANLFLLSSRSIQQKEIDTHLNVLHVAVNSNYASFTDTGLALDRMTALYGNGRTSWHFPKADLHHGLLGRSMGGGMAWVGALCSPNFGYGVSTGLQGKFTQMSSAVVYDFMVVSLALHVDHVTIFPLLSCSTTPPPLSKPLHSYICFDCSNTSSCMNLAIILALRTLTILFTRPLLTPVEIKLALQCFL